MTLLEVFDPPLCCSTGVCGPDPDARLSQFAADFNWLKSQGVDVRRHNLKTAFGTTAARPSSWAFRVKTWFRP